ncbi:MAG TPA: DinB family protein [Candidatus Sulfotelmatobacter sp.]|nr:DinB family protein [Candidatus Sulfotelmatobacter sp.]
MAADTAAVLAELNGLWREVEEMVQALPPHALTYRPGPGFNSISVLATHLAGSQSWWVGEIIAGRAMHRDRDAEFRTEEADHAALVARLRQAATLVREVVEALPADSLDETRPYRGQPMTLRAILMRLLAHAARHVGQMQILRKLWTLQAARAAEHR